MRNSVIYPVPVSYFYGEGCSSNCVLQVPAGSLKEAIEEARTNYEQYYSEWYKANARGVVVTEQGGHFANSDYIFEYLCLDVQAQYTNGEFTLKRDDYRVSLFYKNLLPVYNLNSLALCNAYSARDVIELSEILMKEAKQWKST